eukprot:jgi/Chrzof1/5906/Cz16g20070.t1
MEQLAPNLFSFLQLPPNVVTSHLVPCLSDKDKAALSQSCKAIRGLVTHSAGLAITLKRGNICRAADLPLWARDTYPNCQTIRLEIGSLHDALYGVPKLLVTVCNSLPKLQEISIRDHLLDEFDDFDNALSDGAHINNYGAPDSLLSPMAPSGRRLAPDGVCDGCDTETCSHDLSPLVLSIQACFPMLTRLHLHTKVLSDAECAAVACLQHLTSLSFESEDGTFPGALARLAPLTTLKHFTLGDADGSNPDDVEVICNLVTSLTSLSMGYAPRMQPPVLRRLQKQCHTADAKNSNNSNFPCPLRQLAVNIDAEEGEEILREMADLTPLRGLVVDATDEFAYDPGFQPYGKLHNLEELVVSMPMSLANTQSLEACSNLHKLVLCTLPENPLKVGSLRSVTQLELLRINTPHSQPKVFGAFPSLKRLVVRQGADDVTLEWVGKQCTSLEALELYKLPLGYSTTGVQAIGRLPNLKLLILELDKPGSQSAVAMGQKWGSRVQNERGRAMHGFKNPHANSQGWLPSLLSKDHVWFPRLHELKILGHVVAADQDLTALLELQQLEKLRMHVVPTRESRGSKGVTKEGLKQLVDGLPRLQEVWLTGAVDCIIRVPGRMPGIYADAPVLSHDGHR